MTPDFILQVLLAGGVGAGVYAAIKADLTRAILTAERAQADATDAHGRINQHIENHHVRE